MQAYRYAIYSSATEISEHPPHCTAVVIGLLDEPCAHPICTVIVFVRLLSETSTGLYRSCAALASFSGTFDLILFEAVNFEFIVKKVWFGLD